MKTASRSGEGKWEASLETWSLKGLQTPRVQLQLRSSDARSRRAVIAVLYAIIIPSTQAWIGISCVRKRFWSCSFVIDTPLCRPSAAGRTPVTTLLKNHYIRSIFRCPRTVRHTGAYVYYVIRSWVIPVSHRPKCYRAGPVQIIQHNII